MSENDTTPLPAAPVEAAPELTLKEEAKLLANTEFPPEEFPLPDQTPEDLGAEKDEKEESA